MTIPLRRCVRLWFTRRELLHSRIAFATLRPPRVAYALFAATGVELIEGSCAEVILKAASLPPIIDSGKMPTCLMLTQRGRGGGRLTCVTMLSTCFKPPRWDEPSDK